MLCRCTSPLLDGADIEPEPDAYADPQLVSPMTMIGRKRFGQEGCTNRVGLVGVGRRVRGMRSGGVSSGIKGRVVKGWVSGSVTPVGASTHHGGEEGVHSADWGLH